MGTGQEKSAANVDGGGAAKAAGAHMEDAGGAARRRRQEVLAVLLPGGWPLPQLARLQRRPLRHR